jgi:hypothetical protein
MLVGTSIGDTSLRPLSGSGVYAGTAPAGRKSLKGLGFALALPIPSASEQYGTLTGARLAMLPAAITSASPAKLHDVQINEDCVLRLALSIHPHFGHVRLVLRGSTRCTGTPDN